MAPLHVMKLFPQIKPLFSKDRFHKIRKLNETYNTEKVKKHIKLIMPDPKIVHFSYWEVQTLEAAKLSSNELRCSAFLKSPPTLVCMSPCWSCLSANHTSLFFQFILIYLLYQYNYKN